MDINNLSFNNSKITIVLDDNDEPWFKAKDIAQAMEYINLDHCVRKNIVKKTLESLIPFWEKELFNEKNSIFINESSLYSLILSSKKEDAKKFKEWVIREVLPSFENY